MTAELGVRVDERAAALTLLVPGLQGVEDRGHLIDGVRSRLLEATGEELLPAQGAAAEVERHQRVLRSEPVVERLLRRARRLGDQVDADRADAPVVEQVRGGVEQAMAGRGQGRQVVEPDVSPMSAGCS